MKKILSGLFRLGPEVSIPCGVRGVREGQDTEVTYPSLNTSCSRGFESYFLPMLIWEALCPVVGDTVEPVVGQRPDPLCSHL